MRLYPSGGVTASTRIAWRKPSVDRSRSLRQRTIGPQSHQATETLGIAASFALTRLLETMLFGVSATDAVSFGRATALVLGSVIVATVVPA